MASVKVSFSFTYGKGILKIGAGTIEALIESHWLNDRLHELTRAVLMLVEGTESVSCRWQGPVHEGHFIDLVRDPDGGVSIAISEFVSSPGDEACEIWGAARGPVVLNAHVPFNEFVFAFTKALRVVRTFNVDSAGLIHDYPRPFPQSLFDTLEEKCQRLGYKPQSADDLRHDFETDPA